MEKPWESDNCDAIRTYFSYYTFVQAAILWCGVLLDQIEKELERAQPVATNNEYWRHILRHPYIPCFEPRCRVLQDAINNKKLEVGWNDNGHMIMKQSVAYEQRTLNRDHLKAWMAREFPSEKPAFLFDEIERNTHAAINIEAFCALQVERNALKVQLKNVTHAYQALKHEHDVISNECDSLRAKMEKTNVPGERAEPSYLNIIGGLLGLLVGKSPSGKAYSSFDSEAAIISALIVHHPKASGIAERTLQKKFVEAKRSLPPPST